MATKKQLEEDKNMAKNENTFKKNYAMDQGVCDRFWDMVKGPILQARQNRYAKEQQWLEDTKIWACNLTESHIYQGRSGIFIPEAHHQIEQAVDKYIGALFPSENYLGVIPTKSTSEETANQIQAAVYDQLEYRNRIRCMFEVHGRQRKICGNSPLRGTFVDRSITIYTKDKASGRVIPSVIPRYRGVLWEPVDIFRWYIVPEWAEIDTAFMIFEDDFVPKRQLTEAKIDGKPTYLNLDDIRELDASMDDHQWIDLQRLQANQISDAAVARPGQVFITRVFTEFDFEPGKFVPAMAEIANNGTIVKLIRNPFWFQHSNYVVGRYRRWPVKNFYAMSLPDRIRTLSYAMSETAGQTMDSLNYILNPIAIIDPALAGDPSSFKLQPGAKWWGSPQGISFQNFPDVSGSGWQGMQQLRAMISQFSDNATMIAPQLQGKARSATQASMVNNEVSKDLKLTAMMEETEVLSPMCHMTHSLLRQYQKDEWQIRIQGPDGGAWKTQNVKPEDIEGEVDFIWYGSTASEKTAMRTQQLMNFYQMAIQATMQLPQMQGKIDMPALFQRVAQEGFGLERLEDFMIDIRSKKTVDPEVENIALEQGQEVLPHEADDDDHHLKIHQEGFKNAKTDDEKLAFLRHMERQRINKEAKEKLKQQQAQLQALQMANSQMGAGQGGGGGQPAPGGALPGAPGQGQPGRPFQIPQTANEADMQRGMRAVQPNMGSGS